tara:strand:- start:562 stop:1602 length:1041 start_codon:yes stop_codon:yes gene_type:complete
MSGVTPPPSEDVSLTVNGDTFIDLPCGSDYNLPVKDTNGLSVGVKVGSEWIVPATGGGLPASNQVNGAAKTDIPAGGSKDFVIQDAGGSPIVVTQISDSATEFVGSIPAADPVVNSMNAAPLIDAASGTTKAFTIRYADDSAVVVTTISDSATAFLGEVPDNAIPSDTSEIFKTGASISQLSGDDAQLQLGAGVDFFTLSVNNQFGNANRFTDDLGTQIYSTNVILDWSTYDSLGGKVRAYFKTPISSTRLDTALSAQPYTRNSFSGWYVPNVKQLQNIQSWNSANTFFNYAPFNYSTGSLWTSTPTTSNKYWAISGVSSSAGGSFFSAVFDVILTRQYTLTELGL